MCRWLEPCATARGLPSCRSSHFTSSGRTKCLVRNPPTEAVILVGVQGSGKTSFYRERFFDSHIRISLDMLRTRRRERLLFAACHEAKQPFVIDNTNPLPSDRSQYIAPARAIGFRV